MKIEVGKYYKSANGRKVGPIKVHEHGGVDGYPFDASGEHGTSHFYNEDGKADDGPKFDLIAEWEDAPQDDEWSEWEGVGWVTEHSAFYEGCVYQIEGTRGPGAQKVRIKLRPEDKPAQDPGPLFTDDEINRIAKAVADAVAGALKP